MRIAGSTRLFRWLEGCLPCAAAVAVAGLVGCGQPAAVVPTAPSPTTASAPTPVPRPPAQTVRGEIRVAALTHPTGSALYVDDCGPAWTGIAGSHLCTTEWRGAFDVVIDRTLSDVYITVAFENDGRRCGQVELGGQHFAAGVERLVSTSSPLYLTYEPEGYDNLAVTEYCRLDPRTTNQVIVRLWHNNPAVPILVGGFEHHYRFLARAR